MHRIEVIFGMILAAVVVVVAAYAVSTSNFGGAGAGGAGPVVKPVDKPIVKISAGDPDQVCRCYEEAFKLAGSDVGVTSSQYRTGFEQCRAMLGVAGGDAWTAGWNARLSAKPYEASCRSYRKKFR